MGLECNIIFWVKKTIMYLCIKTSTSRQVQWQAVQGGRSQHTIRHDGRELECNSVEPPYLLMLGHYLVVLDKCTMLLLIVLITTVVSSHTWKIIWWTRIACRRSGILCVLTTLSHARSWLPSNRLTWGRTDTRTSCHVRLQKRYIHI